MPPKEGETLHAEIVALEKELEKDTVKAEGAQATEARLMYQKNEATTYKNKVDTQRFVTQGSLNSKRAQLFALLP